MANSKYGAKRTAHETVMSDEQGYYRTGKPILYSGIEQESDRPRRAGEMTLIAFSTLAI